MISLVVLAAVCEVPLPNLRNLVNGTPVLIGAILEVNIWGVPSLPLNGHTLLIVLAALPFRLADLRTNRLRDIRSAPASVSEIAIKMRS
jgi:hypothetical protein